MTFSAVPTNVGGGSNEIIDCVAWPQPNPKQLRLNMKGASDKIRVLVYTRGYVLVGAMESAGATGPGWMSAPLPSLAEQSAGTYFYRVQSLKNGAPDPGRKSGRIVLIR